MATRLTTVAVVNLRLGRGSGSDRPDVCAESGGVAPGGTPPPGSRPGVFAGSGSGGWAVIRPPHTPSWWSHTSTVRRNEDVDCVSDPDRAGREHPTCRARPPTQRCRCAGTDAVVEQPARGYHSHDLVRPDRSPTAHPARSGSRRRRRSGCGGWHRGRSRTRGFQPRGRVTPGIESSRAGAVCRDSDPQPAPRPLRRQPIQRSASPVAGLGQCV
jgi:hypothetical protein